MLGYPLPSRSTGIRDLAEKREVIYGAQSLTGKILSHKELGPIFHYQGARNKLQHRSFDEWKSMEKRRAAHARSISGILIARKSLKMGQPTTRIRHPRDPSLRPKNGYGQDDAMEVRRLNHHPNHFLANIQYRRRWFVYRGDERRG